MTAKEVLKSARDEIFKDEDGNSYSLTLRPGLSVEELREFEKRFPKPIPDDIRELLVYCRGFEFNPVEDVDFTGNLSFEDTSAFPCGVPIVPDGCGNFWVVDVSPETGAWGPVFYAAHDPPVYVYQSPNLESFLSDLIKLDHSRRQGEQNAIDLVHKEASLNVWRKNPGLLSTQQARASGDEMLRAFVDQLGDAFEICDLRRAEVGAGFSLGRARAEPGVRRFGDTLLFAVEKKQQSRGLLSRLFGSK